MSNNAFFVITGGPGSGKTTLLNELARLGFKCIPEVAREIIKEQIASKGEALPWKNTGRYTQLMLERSQDSYLAAEARSMVRKGATGNEITFFDRGIPDTLCYARLINTGISEEMDRMARKFRYNKKVFMLPPWREIYQTDTERKQTWEEAVRTFGVMADTYLLYGYDVIAVTKGPVKERAEFILGRIMAGAQAGNDDHDQDSLGPNR